MIKISKRLQGHLAVWGMALALTGCFRDSDPAAPMTPVMLGPLQAISATATASIMGLLQYQAAVNASSQAAQDGAEPLDVSDLVLPTSETAEPSDV